MVKLIKELKQLEKDRYFNLIQQELAGLPSFVNEYNIGTNLSTTTTYQYLTEFRRFFDWLRLSGLTDATTNTQVLPADLEKLRRNDIMLFIDYVKHASSNKKHTISPTTINRSINALRSLYKFLTITSDNLNGNPYFERNVMLKIKSVNATQTLSYRAHAIKAHMLLGDEKFEFLDFIDNVYASKINKQAIKPFEKNKTRDLALIALMLGTGIRVSEAANIDLNDINLNDKYLDIIRKGGQKDTIPIADWAISYLSNYLQQRTGLYHPSKEQNALFITEYHGSINRIASNSIERLVSKYSTAFGRKLTPHKLRHTVASEIYHNTKDQVVVAQQLGQKGTSATSLYTHVDPEQQRAALNEDNQSGWEKTN